MIKWFYYWDEWRNAYWERVDRYPELFVFLHRMYIFQHLHETASNKTEPKPGRATGMREPSTSAKPARQQIRKRMKPKRSQTSAAKAGNLSQNIDVLFDTRAARSTCLGVGERLLEMLGTRHPQIKTAFYQNARRRIIPSDSHLGHRVITLHIKPSLPAIGRFLWLLPIIYYYGLKSSTVLRFLLLHPLLVAVNLLKITLLTDSIDRLLAQTEPKIIISCNEQNGSDSSALFAVARKRGIHTIQYLHCPPTRQFVPFISDEFWSWSDLTTRMLLGDAHDSRVLNIGSLEHQRIESTTAKKSTNTNKIRILFLSQIGMDEGWGISSVKDGIQLLKEGIQDCKRQVDLRIREHPNAGIRERNMLAEALMGVAYELSNRETSLAMDVGWATHVYAVSSNAIFAGLLGGKPSFLLWNAELDEIYGQCFLPEAYRVTNRRDMINSIEAESLTDYEAVIDHVIGQPNAVDRATERIAALVKP